MRDTTALRLRRPLGAALLAVVCLGGTVAAQEDLSDATVGEAIRARLTRVAVGGPLGVAGKTLSSGRAVRDFYTLMDFAPAWSREGQPRPEASDLVSALWASSVDGLEPEFYGATSVAALLEAVAEAPELERLVDLDLLLTDAFLTLGSDLLQGRATSDSVDPAWLANRREVDFIDGLVEALEQGRIASTLQGLRPHRSEYQALAGALYELRALQAAGGWPQLALDGTLRPGERDPAVGLLRARLDVSGDLNSEDAGGDEALFDESVEEAVRGFQARHGLEMDGLVGHRTLVALNVPVDERIEQVLVNMERWRWLPGELGERHIRVNVAGFEAELWDQGRPVFQARSIVGRKDRETPSFSASIDYLVLAPYWHVPPTIAAVDKLPLIKDDPDYIADHRMTLFDAETSQPVDPHSVEWTAIDGKEFNARFRLRQEPGPDNALGHVKFVFPNGYKVFLHDTPSRELFAQSRRDLSSGCVRIEDPLELARKILEDDPAWSSARLEATIAAGEEVNVWLPEPIPIHLLYWTAFVDEAGRLNFRDDVYGRDPQVMLALAHGTPDSSAPE